MANLLPGPNGQSVLCQLVAPPPSTFLPRPKGFPDQRGRVARQSPRGCRKAPYQGPIREPSFHPWPLSARGSHQPRGSLPAHRQYPSQKKKFRKGGHCIGTASRHPTSQDGVGCCVTRVLSRVLAEANSRGALHRNGCTSSDLAKRGQVLRDPRAHPSLSRGDHNHDHDLKDLKGVSFFPPPDGNGLIGVNDWQKPKQED